MWKRVNTQIFRKVHPAERTGREHDFIFQQKALEASVFSKDILSMFSKDLS